MYKRFHKEILTSDNALEYMQYAFQKYCAFFLALFIITTCAHTPQYNDVVEHKNRHLLDISHIIMIHVHILKYFGGDTLLTTCYFVNYVPSLYYMVKHHFLLFTKIKACLNLHHVSLVSVFCACIRKET